MSAVADLPGPPLLTDVVPRHLLDQADQVLAGWFEESVSRAGGLGEEYVALWRALQSSAEGGKRLRPALVIGCHLALGGSAQDVAVRVAAAFELLHTAFVVHDDVIDRDLTRRGRPNVGGTFAVRAARAGLGPRETVCYAQSAAILAGDLALWGAGRLVATLDVPPATRLELLDLLDRAVFVSAAGELSDVAGGLGVEEVLLGRALTVTERKTAAYSFEAPLIAGAVLAGAPRPTVEALAGFGRRIGTAFQLVDDLLGVFGAEEITGKSVLSDLREGKRTALVAAARRTSAWPRIAALIGKHDLDEDEAQTVRAVLIGCGAKASVEHLVRSSLADARELARRAEIPPGLGRMLDVVVDTAVWRQA